MVRCSGGSKEAPAASSPSRRIASNKAGSTNVPDDGPIPQGSYYIVERPSGGRVGQFEKLRSALVAGGTSPVPGSSLRRYGTVSVI